MAYIEYVNNPIEKYEKDEQIQAREKSGLTPFWEWEQSLLEQELTHMKTAQKKLNAQIKKEHKEILLNSNAD